MAIESLVFQNRLLNGTHSTSDIKFSWFHKPLFMQHVSIDFHDNKEE